MQPLIQLTCKGVPFEFREEQLDTMNKLKQTLAESPALKVIDYVAKREVVLVVDSSNMGVGYILMQEGEDKQRCPSWFGSITWNNERLQNYLVFAH